MKKLTKKLIKKLKKLDKSRFFAIIDDIIEHRLFKPIVISMITSFVLFRGLSYISSVIADYKEASFAIYQATPIKINISNNGVNFELEEDQVIEHRVKSGDTMLKILFNIGASEDDISDIMSEMKKVFNPKAISVGDIVSIKYRLKIGYDTAKAETDNNVARKVIINSVGFTPSFEKKYVVTRQAAGKYSAKEVEIKLDRHISKYVGVIKNGLFVDGVESGISPNSMMNMINFYSYDVDFQRDIRSGDKFEMLVESFYNEDGKKVKDGNILFSSLTLQGRKIDIYMHKIDGRFEYFDAKGQSTRKSLLRTPINGARVSSGFGLRRHPVLGYSKMHKGVDFAAPSGTPIFAAGSGTIVYYGVKGGYGNFVQIKHNSEYSTAYGHASRFVKKLHNGAKVKQGDVVAYVGSTGRSTGPHLHFEVVYKGAAINPAKVKATSGLTLSGKELARFKNSKAEIERYLRDIPNQVKR